MTIDDNRRWQRTSKRWLLDRGERWNRLLLNKCHLLSVDFALIKTWMLSDLLSDEWKNDYSGEFVPVMFLQSFLLSSWSSMSYKKTLSPFSSISASWKQVRGNDRPATDPPARERIFLVSTKRAPTRPPSCTVVHITSCLGARWYISLTTLSRRRRSKPLAVDHNWPFLSCVCAEDGSTRTTGRVLRRWLMRRRKYKYRYTSKNTWVAGPPNAGYGGGQV